MRAAPGPLARLSKPTRAATQSNHLGNIFIYWCLCVHICTCLCVSVWVNVCESVCVRNWMYLPVYPAVYVTMRICQQVTCEQVYLVNWWTVFISVLVCVFLCVSVCLCVFCVFLCVSRYLRQEDDDQVYVANWWAVSAPCSYLWTQWTVHQAV